MLKKAVAICTALLLCALCITALAASEHCQLTLLLALGILPQTGDESDLLLYACVGMLMLASAAAMGLMLYRRRKEA